MVKRRLAESPCGEREDSARPRDGIDRFSSTRAAAGGFGIGQTFANVFSKVAVRSRKAESRAKVAVWGLGLRRSVGGRGLTGKVLRSRTARLTD